MADKHGNLIAKEGCDRCPCGVKYWENDRCVDCGSHVLTALPYITGDGERHENFEAAREHAQWVWSLTGSLISIEKGTA